MNVYLVDTVALGVDHLTSPQGLYFVSVITLPVSLVTKLVEPRPVLPKERRDDVSTVEGWSETKYSTSMLTRIMYFLIAMPIADSTFCNIVQHTE